MVALAKASSVAWRGHQGLAAGFVIYLSGSLSAPVPRQDAVTAAVTLAAAVVLTCAALYLEYCCRVPDLPDRDRTDQGARRPDRRARPHPPWSRSPTATSAASMVRSLRLPKPTTNCPGRSAPEDL